jgi:ABC-2 type transport system permease protein
MKKGYLRTTLRQVYEIFTEELKNIFKDSGVVILFFGATLLYPILYGFIYKNEACRDVAVALVDERPSALSRELARQLDATPELAVYRVSGTMDEAKRLLEKGKVKGIIFIPSAFGEDVAEGQQTQVFAYCNMASMMYYRAVYAGLNLVVQDMNLNLQIQQLEGQGLIQRQAEVTAQPILSEGRSLSNPTGGFASFLLPAVMVLIIQQTLVLGIGMLAGTAREENTFHQLIPYQRKYHGTMRIITGKALAYLVLYSFIALYDLLLIPTLFQLPHHLTVGTILPFLLPFLLACVFFSMALSVFFWNREMSLLLFLCTSVPLLFLSGFSWPTTHIHDFWRMISYFSPSTFGVNAYLRMNTAGASPAAVQTDLLALWIQAGVYFIVAWFVYRWQIQQSERKLEKIQ